jgi:hypothetical protein
VQFRQQLRSIIKSEQANLELKNVSFRYIQVYGAHESAIILQDSCDSPPYYCGSFKYDAGIVEFTNYGYELTIKASFSGFLLSDGHNSIQILSVKFSYNNIFSLSYSGRDYGSLLVFKRFRNLSIEDCEFRYNWGLKGGAIMIQSQGLSLPVINTSTSDDATLHILIQNTKFINNASSNEGSAIYINFPTEVLNLEISDCQFENNISANSYGVLVINNSSLLKPEHIDGGIFDSVVYNARYAKLTNLEFNSNYHFGVGSMYLSNLANVEIEGLTIENSGQSYTDIGVNQLWVDEYIGESYYITKYPDFFEPPRCSGIVYIEKSYNLDISEVNVSNNLCNDLNAGIHIIESSGLTNIQDLTISGNKVITDGFSALICENSEQLNMHDFTISSNSGYHVGAVYISNRNE